MNHDNYADGFVRLVKLAAAKYVSQCELTYTLHGVPEYVASDRATAPAPTGGPRLPRLPLDAHERELGGLAAGNDECIVKEG